MKQHEPLRGGEEEGHSGEKGRSGEKEGVDSGPLCGRPPAGTKLTRRWEDTEQGLWGGVSRC